jgi:hypothetical protein
VEKNIITCSVTASGNYIPPILIYSSKPVSPQLQRNHLVEAPYYRFQNWGITGELFFEGLLLFKQFIKPSKDRLVLITGTPIKMQL